MPDSLQDGRTAYGAHAWARAYRTLTTADQDTPLTAADLELLANAAYLIGREDDFAHVLERAHNAHQLAGDTLGAARCAFWLGMTHLLAGATARATGWLARARRLVDGRDCAEQGYLLLPVAEEALAAGNDSVAHATASHAASIGQRFDDADLIACSRHIQGRALIHEGQLQDGLTLLDEAMLAVTGGHLSPMMTGLVYCSVIEACQQTYALDRAREWTSALGQWCDAQPQMVAFTATCLVRRAEILQLHGDWSAAMKEAERACARRTQHRHTPPAAALYQQAEIHRLRGAFAAAEQAYRYAGHGGWDPQPGLALLRMAQGHPDRADTAIRLALDATTERLARTRLLPAFVEIQLAQGDPHAAREASHELADTANQLRSEVLGAMAAQASGAVALADGDAREAMRQLRRVRQVWSKLEVPHAAAQVRVLLGLACRALGDEDGAALELDAARDIFQTLGAVPDLARIDAIRHPASPVPAHGLTPRELQVLRLVATGKTNKVIAEELSVSERTIDRHVSNIFTKLDVPSRAAATAYAYKHKLL